MRLIDADKIINDLEAMRTQFDAIALDGLIRGIEEQPTIDAEPVRHGRWVDGMPYTNSHWKVCSVCHKSADYPSGGDEYCGHCNAKMDEGADINVPDTQINGGAEDGHEQA